MSAKRSAVKNASIRDECVLRILVLKFRSDLHHEGKHSQRGSKSARACVICLPAHQLHHHAKRAPVDILPTAQGDVRTFIFLRQWVESFPLTQTSPSLLTTELLIRTSAGKLQPISQTLWKSFEKTGRQRLIEWDYRGAGCYWLLQSHSKGSCLPKRI